MAQPETARHVHRYEVHLPTSADEVWAGPVADRPLPWCRALNGRYTSSRPFGVGTTCEVGVKANTRKLRERYFIWDEARRRHAFDVEQANRPLFSLTQPLNKRLLLDGLIRDTARHFNAKTLR